MDKYPGDMRNRIVTGGVIDTSPQPGGGGNIKSSKCVIWNMKQKKRGRSNGQTAAKGRRRLQSDGAGNNGFRFRHVYRHDTADHSVGGHRGRPDHHSGNHYAAEVKVLKVYVFKLPKVLNSLAKLFLMRS